MKSFILPTLVLLATIPACTSAPQEKTAPGATAPPTLAKTCLEVYFSGSSASSAPMLIQFPTYAGSFAALPEKDTEAATSPYDAPMPLNISYTPSAHSEAIISLQNYNTQATLALQFSTPHSGHAKLTWQQQGAAPFSANAPFTLKSSPSESVRIFLPAFPAGQ